MKQQVAEEANIYGEELTLVISQRSVQPYDKAMFDRKMAIQSGPAEWTMGRSLNCSCKGRIENLRITNQSFRTSTHCVRRRHIRRYIAKGDCQIMNQVKS